MKLLNGIASAWAWIALITGVAVSWVVVSIVFILTVPFDTQGREIRISMIGRGANGVQSAYDPREGVQTTFSYSYLTDLGVPLTDGGNTLTDS